MELSLLFKLSFFMFILEGRVHATAHMWRSEDNSWELVLSFHHVFPEGHTQVMRLSGGTAVSSVISGAPNLSV